MITIDFTTEPKEFIPEYVEDKYGIKRLSDENGKLHSYNDLPAIIRPNGTKVWFKHGLKHRENNLPAIIYPIGTKEYWINGKFIRHENL